MTERGVVLVGFRARRAGRVCLSLAVAGLIGVSASGGAGAASAQPEDEASSVQQPCPSSAQAVASPGARPSGFTANNAYQAQMIAFALGSPVEDVSQRTESSQVFATPDGMWLAKEFLGDNWVQTGGDGNAIEDWSAIDLTLVVSEDGLVRPAVYPGSLALAPGGEKTDTIVTTTLGDSGVVMKVLWDGSKLPPVVLDGARATYLDVWPGVDYVVDVRLSGFEQYFVLKTQAAAIARADELSLPMEVEGGSLEADGDGGVRILDGSGSVVGIMPVAYAWDADEDGTQLAPVLRPWSPEPHVSDGIRVANVPDVFASLIENATKGMSEPQRHEVGLTASQEDGGVRVGFELDVEWLTDPSTVYPVVVDPTAVALWVSYDTYVRSAYPNTNYGTDTEIRIGTADGGVTKSRTYLTFDTTVLKTRDIQYGYLWLWNYYSATCTPNYWYAYWTAPASSSTTWNNPPAYRSSAYLSSTATVGHTSGTTPYCATGWVTMTISPFLTAWTHHPENTQGLFLTTMDETLNARWKRFYSYENASPYKPHIGYVYNQVPTTPTSVWFGTTELTGSEPITLPSGQANTVTVSAEVSDPDGGQVGALFTIKQDGIVIIDSLPGTVVDSEQVSEATLPYTLAPDVEYTIEVRVTDTRLISEVYAPTTVFGVLATSPTDLPTDDDDDTGVA